jgi:hypothetical protein
MRTPRVHVNHGPIGSCGNLPGIDVGTTPALPGWGPPAGKGGSVLEDVVADLACPHGDPSLPSTAARSCARPATGSTSPGRAT